MPFQCLDLPRTLQVFAFFYGTIISDMFFFSEMFLLESRSAGLQKVRRGERHTWKTDNLSLVLHKGYYMLLNSLLPFLSACLQPWNAHAVSCDAQNTHKSVSNSAFILLLRVFFSFWKEIILCSLGWPWTWLKSFSLDVLSDQGWENEWRLLFYWKCWSVFVPSTVLA